MVLQSPSGTDLRSTHGHWRRAIILGVRLALTTIVAVVVYAALTPDRPGRVWLWVTIGVASVVAAGLRLLPWNRLIQDGASAVRVTVAWLGILAGAITVACVIDGGFQSPLQVLYPLPVVYAAVVARTRAVVTVGGVASLLSVMTGPLTGTFDPGTAALLVASPLLAAAVGSAIAEGYAQQHRTLRNLTVQLGDLARLDSLTRCLNHGAFHQELAQAVDALGGDRAEPGTSLSVLVVDIDHFKRVNDTHGHPVGDRALVAVAEAMRSAVRPGDVVARTGGEEFAVLMYGAEADHVQEVGERIRRRISEIDDPVRITVSVGAASTAAGVDRGGVAGRVFDEADRALYAAKHAGRDRLVVADT